MAAMRSYNVGRSTSGQMFRLGALRALRRISILTQVGLLSAVALTIYALVATSAYRNRTRHGVGRLQVTAGHKETVIFAAGREELTTKRAEGSKTVALAPKGGLTPSASSTVGKTPVPSSTSSTWHTVLDQIAADAQRNFVRYRNEKAANFARAHWKVSSVKSPGACGASGGDPQTYRVCGGIRYCCGVCTGRKQCTTSVGTQVEDCACIIPNDVPRPILTTARRCNGSQVFAARTSSQGTMSRPFFTRTPINHIRCTQHLLGSLADLNSSTRDLIVMTSRRSGGHLEDDEYSNFVFSLQYFGYGPVFWVDSPVQLSARVTHDHTGSTLDPFVVLRTLPANHIVLLLHAKAALLLGSARRLIAAFRSNRLCTAAARCDAVIAPRDASDWSASIGIIGYASTLLSLLKCIGATPTQSHANETLSRRRCLFGGDLRSKVGVDRNAAIFTVIPSTATAFDLQQQSTDSASADAGLRQSIKPSLSFVALVHGLHDRDRRTRPLDAFPVQMYNHLGALIHAKSQSTGGMSALTRVVVALQTTVSQLHRIESSVLSLAMTQSLRPDAVYVTVTGARAIENITIPHSITRVSRVVIEFAEFSVGALFAAPLKHEHNSDTLVVLADALVEYPTWFVHELVSASQGFEAAAYSFGGSVIDMDPCPSSPSANAWPRTLDISTVAVHSANEWRHRHAAVDVVSVRSGTIVPRRYLDANALRSAPTECRRCMEIWFSAVLARKGVPRIRLPSSDHETIASTVQTGELVVGKAEADGCSLRVVHDFLKSRTVLPEACPVRFQPLAARHTTQVVRPVPKQKIFQNVWRTVKSRRRWDSQTCRVILPRTPCFKVDALYINETICTEFLKSRTTNPDCSYRHNVSTVPRILHAFALQGSAPLAVYINAIRNPTFRLNFVNLSTGQGYIDKHCGTAAALAFLRSKKDPEFASLIFRFCALAFEGGVFVDHRYHLVVPLEVTYSSCSQTTFGLTLAACGEQGCNRSKHIVPTAQIVAGTNGSFVHSCVLSRLIKHGAVARSAEVTASAHLDQCVNECLTKGSCSYDSGQVGSAAMIAVTYRSTIRAAWPYTGLVGSDKLRDTLFAFRQPDGDYARHIDTE